MIGKFFSFVFMFPNRIINMGVKLRSSRIVDLGKALQKAALEKIKVGWVC
jgi:hypothetical protein